MDLDVPLGDILNGPDDGREGREVDSGLITCC